MVAVRDWLSGTGIGQNTVVTKPTGANSGNAPVTGDIVYAVLAMDGSLGNTVTPPDASWTVESATPTAFPLHVILDGQWFHIYKHTFGASEPASWTFVSDLNPGNSHSWAVVVVQDQNASVNDTTTVTTVNSSANSSPVTVSSGGITTATANDLLLFIAVGDPAVSSSGSWTAPTGFTGVVSSYSNFAPIQIAWKIQAATGATGTISSTLTFASGSAGYGIALLAIKPLAGSGTTYTITPSGGITFSGTAAQIKTNVVVPSGSFVFSGAAALIKSKVLAPSGTLAFSGTSILSRVKVLSPSGTLTFSGTVALLKTKLLSPSGNITFSGAVAFVKSKVLSLSGGLIFSGSAAEIKTKLLSSAGTITFSGTSPFSQTSQYIINPTGGITFSGALNSLKTKVLLPSGTLVFSGTSALLKSKAILPTGQIVFSGSSSLTFTPAGAVSSRNISRLNLELSRDMGL